MQNHLSEKDQRKITLRMVRINGHSHSFYGNSIFPIFYHFIVVRHFVQIFLFFFSISKFNPNDFAFKHFPCLTKNFLFFVLHGTFGARYRFQFGSICSTTISINEWQIRITANHRAQLNSKFNYFVCFD